MVGVIMAFTGVFGTQNDAKLERLSRQAAVPSANRSGLANEGKADTSNLQLTLLQPQQCSLRLSFLS